MASPAEAQSALAEFQVQADEAGLQGKDSAVYIYWKKGPTDAAGQPARDAGWVTVAQANPQEFMRQSIKGMTPLHAYGRFQFPYDAATKTWVDRERFKLIFARGGAREFPVSQILEYGWHRTPPYSDVQFPQLAGVEIDEAMCPTCRRTFTGLPHITAKDLLAKHESVAHRDRASQDRLVRGLAEAQEKTSEPVAKVLEMLVQSTIQQQAFQQQMMGTMAALGQAVTQLANKVGVPVESPAKAVKDG
jgi:hypothetical protein